VYIRSSVHLLHHRGNRSFRPERCGYQGDANAASALELLRNANQKGNEMLTVMDILRNVSYSTMRQIIEDLREVDVEMAAQVEEMVGDLEVKAEYEQQNDFFVRG